MIDVFNSGLVGVIIIMVSIRIVSILPIISGIVIIIGIIEKVAASDFDFTEQFILEIQTEGVSFG